MGMSLILAGILFVSVLTEAGSNGSTRNETMAAALMSRILNKSDSRIRPYIYGQPVQVQCDFFVASFGSINAVDMDFQVDVYFRQRWVDHRLAFDEQETPVILPAKSIEKIWVPDLFFPNEKSADYHDVTVQNQVVKIFPNGTVRYSSRITLKLNCPMVLKNFPMDYQNCYIKISSYSYTSEDVVLDWMDNSPVELNAEELSLPQFELEKTGTKPCKDMFKTDAYDETDVILTWFDSTPVEMDEPSLPRFTLIGISNRSCELKYKTGVFSCLMVEFHLKRQFGYYLLQAYIPSMLIVILSWVSFWIHRDAVPARITLGVTTVLTMATQLSGSRGTTITVSYAKALDVWYAFCMILVFSALIEYALVNSLTRMEADKKRKRREFAADGCGLPESPRKEMVINQKDSVNATEIELRPINEENNLKMKEPNEGALPSMCFKHGVLSADGVDKAARVLFPSIFCLFNVIYWIYYTQPVVYVDVE